MPKLIIQGLEASGTFNEASNILYTAPSSGATTGKTNVQNAIDSLNSDLVNLESDLDNFGSQQTLIGEIAQGGNVTVDTTKYNYIRVIFTTNKDPFDFVTPAKVNRSTQWVSEIMGSNYTISVKINYVSGVFRWYETSTSSGASVTKCSVYGIK